MISNSTVPCVRYETTVTLGKDKNGKPIRKIYYSYESMADAREKALLFKRQFNHGKA
jgi:hypothetical protein